MTSTTNPRAELAERLPRAVQPVVTWLSGIPIDGQAPLVPMTPLRVISLGILSILTGFLLIHAALGQATLAATVALYLLGFFFVSGGMRRLDVLVIHQTLHSKVLATPRGNRILGEVLTTLLLRTPYDENQKEHLMHHRSPCDEDDVDVVFLREAGVSLTSSPGALYLRVLAIALSPAFHLNFLANRLRGNFLDRMPAYRRAMSLGYAALLFGPTAFLGAGYLWTLALYWLTPLVFGFQISNFLYTATKHRWWLFSNDAVKGREKRDLLSYARVCCSAAPERDGGAAAWALWWLKAALVHAPTRLFITVGDTVQHDLHHVAPTCDWPNSAYERTRYLKTTPERFTEVWGGLLAHLKECNLQASAHEHTQHLARA